ncbi:hypothetical protein JW710_02375 [Candidatus Dojkabacteria bacterium]|nr:hypothetical protein [Candidatus Dojkabacteria bacterium]
MSLKRLMIMVIVALGSVGIIMGFGVRVASANTVNLTQPNMILDNFETFDYGTPYSIFLMYGVPPSIPTEGEPYWWTITSNGYVERGYNLECSTEVPLDPSDPYSPIVGGTECVTHEEELDGNGFMRLTIKPFLPIFYDEYGNLLEYHETALDDQPHGFSYYEPNRWEPELGHPVTLTTKVRWSDVYNADGTGDFLGSSGIYLWNMPADYPNNEFHVVRSMGLELISDDSGDAAPELVGLGVSVFKTDNPFYTSIADMLVYRETLYAENEVDIHEWVEFKMEWSENSSGDQHVKFWVNEEFVGETDLPEPFPALGIEYWNDNYDMEPIDGVHFYPGLGVLTVQQDFDVDFIKVIQY